MIKDAKTALFWDYENVPLRVNDYSEFLNSLDALYDNLDIDFTRIYSKKTSMSDGDYELLLNHGFDNNTHFKWVESDDKNAVDNSLIQSCKSVLKDRPWIKQIILIAGDGDFVKLIRDLQFYYLIVICQKYNYNQKLIDLVDEAYSVDVFIEKF